MAQPTRAELREALEDDLTSLTGQGEMLDHIFENLLDYLMERLYPPCP